MSVLLGILLAVLTTFKDGTFHTTYEAEVSAPIDSCNQAIDSMIYYLQTDPEMLSEKFFCGLGMQDDKSKNAFYIHWKESSYDADKQYSRLVLDVLGDEKPFMKDVVVESRVVDTIVGDKRDLRVNIYYAGTLIKEAYGSFHLEPIRANVSKMAMDVHVKFGWFFRIFISRKVYSDTVDWRLVRFVHNLKLTAEGVTPTDEYWNTQSAL